MRQKKLSDMSDLSSISPKLNNLINGPHLDPTTGLLWPRGIPLIKFNLSPSYCKIKINEQ